MDHRESVHYHEHKIVVYATPLEWYASTTILAHMHVWINFGVVHVSRNALSWSTNARQVPFHSRTQRFALLAGWSQVATDLLRLVLVLEPCVGFTSLGVGVPWIHPPVHFPVSWEHSLDTW